MLREGFLATLAFGAFFSLSGCATVMGNFGGLNLDHHMEVYGGVRIDLERGMQRWKELTEPGRQCPTIQFDCV
jgi:hypothetical protein